MKKIFAKILTVLLVLTVLSASLPLSAIAMTVNENLNNRNEAEVLSGVTIPGIIELNDGYISVKVSTSNGGYYMSTVEGDVISKTDNNSDLVYSDTMYDTSF